MTNFVVFTDSRMKKIFRVQDYELQVTENPNFLYDTFCEEEELDGERKIVFNTEENIYIINKVNAPIYVNNVMYIIVDVRQCGYYYEVSNINHSTKYEDPYHTSRSFLSFEECYNTMKREAMSDIAEEIDITQDFEFGQNSIYEFNVTFKEDEITFRKDGDKWTMTYKLKRWE